MKFDKKLKDIIMYVIFKMIEVTSAIVEFKYTNFKLKIPSTF